MKQKYIEPDITLISVKESLMINGSERSGGNDSEHTGDIHDGTGTNPDTNNGEIEIDAKPYHWRYFDDTLEDNF